MRPLRTIWDIWAEELDPVRIWHSAWAWRSGPRPMTSFAEKFLEEAAEKSDADLFKDLFRIYPLAEAGDHYGPVTL